MQRFLSTYTESKEIPRNAATSFGDRPCFTHISEAAYVTDCIVVGNSARLLRKRFDEEPIALLLQWKWWDKPMEEIKAAIPLLTDGNLAEVKQQIRKLIS